MTQLCVRVQLQCQRTIMIHAIMPYIEDFDVSHTVTQSCMWCVCWINLNEGGEGLPRELLCHGIFERSRSIQGHSHILSPVRQTHTPGREGLIHIQDDIIEFEEGRITYRKLCRSEFSPTFFIENILIGQFKSTAVSNYVIMSNLVHS